MFKVIEMAGKDSFEVEAALDKYVTCGTFSMVEELTKTARSAVRHMDKREQWPAPMREVIDNLETMSADEFSRWYKERYEAKYG